MTQDIHEIIARAEQIPGGSVSIDPADPPDMHEPSADDLCSRCGERDDDHLVIDFGGLAGEIHICPGNVPELRAAIIDNEWDFEYIEPDEDDGPDPDRLRDERIDREMNPPDYGD